MVASLVKSGLAPAPLLPPLAAADAPAAANADPWAGIFRPAPRNQGVFPDGQPPALLQAVRHLGGRPGRDLELVGQDRGAHPVGPRQDPERPGLRRSHLPVRERVQVGAGQPRLGEPQHAVERVEGGGGEGEGLCDWVVEASLGRGCEDG